MLDLILCPLKWMTTLVLAFGKNVYDLQRLSWKDISIYPVCPSWKANSMPKYLWLPKGSKTSAMIGACRCCLTKNVKRNKTMNTCWVRLLFLSNSWEGNSLALSIPFWNAHVMPRSCFSPWLLNPLPWLNGLWVGIFRCLMDTEDNGNTGEEVPVSWIVWWFEIWRCRDSECKKPSVSARLQLICVLNAPLIHTILKVIL